MFLIMGIFRQAQCFMYLAPNNVYTSVGWL